MDLTKVSDSIETDEPDLYKVKPSSPSPTFDEEPVLCNIFSQSHFNSSSNTFSDVNDSATVCDIFSSLCEDKDSHVFIENKNKLKNISETSELDEFYGLNIIDCDGSCTHDTWVPSLSTAEILKHIKDNGSEYYLEKKHLTIPVLSFKNNMVDSITELVSKKLGQGETQRNIMNADDVTQDVYGLKELISLGFYRSAVDLTGRLLLSVEKELGANERSIQSDLSARSIQLWFTRFCLLAKLQEWSLLDVEASVWGNCDQPDFYYQSNPNVYGDREGSMIPFQMRLLLAIIPSYCNRHIESVNKLFYILDIVKKIRSSFEFGPKPPNPNECTACIKVWKARETRTMVFLVNVALKMEDFSLAVEIVNKMISNENSSVTRRMLYSTLGRIYLQFGDISASKNCFDEARNCVEKVGSLGHSAHDFQDYVDRGLLALAQSNFEESYKLFEMASYIDPSNLMVMNNCAVCLMYMGHISEAIRLLSGVINNNPVKALHENIVINLVSLYELETSNCTDNKLKLLKIVSLHNSDLIRASSLKIDF